MAVCQLHNSSSLDTKADVYQPDSTNFPLQAFPLLAATLIFNACFGLYNCKETFFFRSARFGVLPDRRGLGLSSLCSDSKRGVRWSCLELRWCT